MFSSKTHTFSLKFMRIFVFGVQTRSPRPWFFWFHPQNTCPRLEKKLAPWHGNPMPWKTACFLGAPLDTHPKIQGKRFNGEWNCQPDLIEKLLQYFFIFFLWILGPSWISQQNPIIFFICFWNLEKPLKMRGSGHLGPPSTQKPKFWKSKSGKKSENLKQGSPKILSQPLKFNGAVKFSDPKGWRGITPKIQNPIKKWNRMK